MKRPNVRRVAFVIVFLALLPLAMWARTAGPFGLLAVLGVLLAPGLPLESGDAAAALLYSERFLATLRQRPWLRHAVWLRGWTYTSSLEAMAVNNIAAAHLTLGAFDAADEGFGDALAIDPEYAIPWVNRATLAFVHGRPDDAAAAMEEARARGYTGGTLDQLSQLAGAILARLEGPLPRERA